MSSKEVRKRAVVKRKRSKNWFSRLSLIGQQREGQSQEIGTPYLGQWSIDKDGSENGGVMPKSWVPCYSIYWPENTLWDGDKTW